MPATFHRLLLVCLLWLTPAHAETPSRIVFVGDSITGQGGGWLNTGYVFKIRDALAAAHPTSAPDLVPLGGSGMGINSWLSLTKDATKQTRDLDVKGVQVAEALSKPADALIIMLGMNDVLAPYVNDTDASLDQWLTHYRELVTFLREKLKPKTLCIATITPQTEDPGSPKNRVMARMNQRLEKLAADLHATLAPTNQMYWQTLQEGRKTQPDFTLAGDRIHPNAAGHLTIAAAMLTALGEADASTWLRSGPLAKILTALKSVPSPTPPPPWLVTSGLILHPWQNQPSPADLAPNATDEAIEKQKPFWLVPPQTWRPFQSSINLTDGANPGSVDFAGITFGQNFEAGYAARWIHTDRERSLNLEIKTSGVGSVIHLTAWLNGQRLYSALLTQEPKRQTTLPVHLHPGWNILAFKSCHRTWQWQQSLTLLEPNGATPEGLTYSASPPPPH